MICKRTIKAGLIGAVLAGGSLAILPGIATAALQPRTFAANQQLLEQQLASRVTQLGRLGSDVTGSKTLTTAHVTALNANIATATTNIKALVAKVPTDKTQAQLNADRASMLKQNRVFAVLTPQVFQTIEADLITTQVATLQANESALQSFVNSLVGQHGYTNASNHYAAFIKSVDLAASNSHNTVGANAPGGTL